MGVKYSAKPCRFPLFQINGWLHIVVPNWQNIDIKSIYSDLLIRSSFDSPRLFDRLSNGVLRSQSSAKSGLCRNYSLPKSNPIRILLDVMSKPDGCQSVPDVHFHHYLFEVVIDLWQECGGWLLFLKRPETSSMFCQGAK
jgi:hypothetical protein